MTDEQYRTLLDSVDRVAVNSYIALFMIIIIGGMIIGILW